MPIYAQNKCELLFENTVSKQDIALTEIQSQFKKSFEDHNIQFKKNLEHQITQFITELQAVGDLGKHKIELLMRLGFYIENNTWKAPTFLEFLNHYIKNLDNLNVPQKDRILPAVAVAKWDGRDYNDHILFTPGFDLWPNKANFSFVAQDGFNIPSKIVVRAEGQGRYPLISAMHDIFHFLTFVEYPIYMKALKSATSKLKEPLSVAVDQKVNFLNEVLSLPNLKRKNEILKTLWSTQGITPETKIPFSHFQDFFLKVPENELLRYGNYFADIFPKFLNDYGGAIYNAKEKEMLMHISDRRILSQALPNFKKSYDEADLALASPAIYGTNLKYLIKYYEKPLSPDRNPFFEPSHEEALNSIRQKLASMEYFLWIFTTQNMTPEHFIQKFIQSDGSTDPGLKAILENIWGPTSTFSKTVF